MLSFFVSHVPFCGHAVSGQQLHGPVNCQFKVIACKSHLYCRIMVLGYEQQYLYGNA